MTWKKVVKMTWKNITQEEIESLMIPFNLISRKILDIDEWYYYISELDKYIDLCKLVVEKNNLDKEDFMSMMHSNIDYLLQKR